MRGTTTGTDLSNTAIRGVIWDVDGTMADTIPMIVRILRRTIVVHGGPDFSRPEIEAMFGPTEEGLLRNVLGADAGAAFEVFLAEYAERHDAEVEAFSGVREVILEMQQRGILQAVVTGKSAPSAAITLEHLGYGDVFDVVAAGSVEGQVKAKEIAGIVGAWGIESAEIVYVGDHPKDVEDAHAAGVLAAVAAWKPDADTTWADGLQPDAVFTTTDALAGWLEIATK